MTDADPYAPLRRNVRPAIGCVYRLDGAINPAWNFCNRPKPTEVLRIAEGSLDVRMVVHAAFERFIADPWRQPFEEHLKTAKTGAEMTGRRLIWC